VEVAVFHTVVRGFCYMLIVVNPDHLSIHKMKMDILSCHCGSHINFISHEILSVFLPHGF